MKSVKKVLSVLLILIMSLCLFVGCDPKKKVDDEVIKADTSWFKDSETTFTISNAAQFYGFSELAKTNNFSGKTIKLGADIKLNNVDATILKNWKEGKAAPKNVWAPIGTTGGNPFAGKFDGQGYTISGLYVDSKVEAAGLFGKVAYTAEIGNFKLVDGVIKSTKSKVGVIGEGLLTKVENIYTNVTMKAEGNFVGGIVGWYEGSYTDKNLGNSEGWTKNPMTIKNCWVDGEIITGSEAYAIGGIVGGQNNRNRIDILNCIFSGTMNIGREDGNTRAGGIYGWVNWSSMYNLKNCLVTGTINAENKASVGAIVGSLAADGLSIVNCYAVGDKAVGNEGGKTYVISDGTMKTLDEIKGLDVSAAFPLLEGETTSPWEKASGSTPVLKGLK